MDDDEAARISHGLPLIRVMNPAPLLLRSVRNRKKLYLRSRLLPLLFSIYHRRRYKLYEEIIRAHLLLLYFRPCLSWSRRLNDLRERSDRTLIGTTMNMIHKHANPIIYSATNEYFRNSSCRYTKEKNNVISIYSRRHEMETNYGYSKGLMRTATLLLLIQ